MDRDEQKQHITDRTLAVPLVGETDFLIDSNAANAAFLLLKRLGSHLPEHVRAQVDVTIENVVRELETFPDEAHFVITKEGLRTIAIDIAQKASAQTISEIGKRTIESVQMDSLFNLPTQRTED